MLKYKNNLSTAQLLLEMGAVTEVKHKEKNTPLNYAALFGNFIIIEKLIKWGASKSAKNIKGETPFNISLNQVTRSFIKRNPNVENIMDYIM